MFFQYAVPGCVFPIISLYLIESLHFSKVQAGTVMAMHPLAGLVSLFVATYIADRYISSKLVFALCHLLSALVMLVMATQEAYVTVLALYFCYGLMSGPTFALSNTIVLHHTTNAEREFGGIRVWGTLGWIVIAWTFGYLWLQGAEEGASRLPHALKLNAGLSLFLAAFTLTMPKSKLKMRTHSTIIPWAALKVFARGDLMLLCGLAFAANVVHQFFYFGMSPFLTQSGCPEAWIMPAMSLGQIAEVVVLATLGWCLTRLSMKQVMVFAMLAQALRFALFALGGPTGGILTGIALHGICFGWFLVPASLYVDRNCTAKVRAGAQQILMFMVAAGSFLGLYLAGAIAQYATPEGTSEVRFGLFWLAPLVLALAGAAVQAIFFRERLAEKDMEIG